MEQRKPLVTISGPPASGTSTLSDNLSETLNFEVINGGDIFRKMASERNVTLQELTEMSEEDDSIDKEVDERLQSIIEEHLSGDRELDGNGLIIESRLSAWHANGNADLSIHLTAPAEVRAERISNRTETVNDLQEREKSEANRYYEYYGIDITDKSVYDLIIDTSNVSVDDMTEQVIHEIITEIPETMKNNTQIMDEVPESIKKFI